MNAFSLHHHFSWIGTDVRFSKSIDWSVRLKSRCKRSAGHKSSPRWCHSSNRNISNQWRVGHKLSQRRSEPLSQQYLHCHSYHSQSLPKVSTLTVSRPLLSPVTAIERSGTVTDILVLSNGHQCSARTSANSLVISLAANRLFIGRVAPICSLFESFVCNQIRSWSCQREFLQQQARVTSHLQCPFSSG